VDSRRRLFIAARCCGAANSSEATSGRRREAFGGPSSRTRACRSHWPIRSRSSRRAAHDLSRACLRRLADRKVVRQGRDGEALRWRWRAASRTGPSDHRAAAGTCTTTRRPGFLRARVDRIWEGTSEIQRLIIATGCRSAARHLPGLGSVRRVAQSRCQSPRSGRCRSAVPAASACPRRRIEELRRRLPIRARGIRQAV
jgi:hypothetical protein